ncbi:MAG: hypothetical protein QOF02_2657, partial [Blastocatellia bacterium]|nr:hypothetical protein [Blastocatellia bacterium]
MLMTKDREGWAPWIVGGAILLVYVCFPTRQYFFDGVAF